LRVSLEAGPLTHYVNFPGTDLQVLTFSVDEDRALVSAYMKEKWYTFPVIHSPVLANKLFPYLGLPSNVLVNAECRRTSLYPLRIYETSLQQVLSDLEKASKIAK
jgi:hypothetical protein